MNIQAEKLELLELLLRTDNESVLKKIRAVFNASKATPRITVKQYNLELKAAEKRIKNGKFITHEDLEAQMEKW
jgi:hypothetical protein